MVLSASPKGPTYGYNVLSFQNFLDNYEKHFCSLQIDCVCEHLIVCENRYVLKWPFDVNSSTPIAEMI